MQSLGDRMKKNYENRARFYLARRTPVIIRIDGRAFHSYTTGMDKPFSQRLTDAMVWAAREVIKDVQGSKLAFIQSDEVSILLTDFDTLQTEAWFDYNKSKIETIAASVMTANFNAIMFEMYGSAVFDARSFNIPEAEVANYFLWRAQDWERNSLQMFARSFFSHKELHEKSKADIHEMLHRIGRNWATDCSPRQKNGTWLVSTGNGIEARHDIGPSWPTINAVVSKLMDFSERSENQKIVNLEPIKDQEVIIRASRYLGK